MARKWARRLAACALLIGGLYSGLVYLDLIRAAFDASARQHTGGMSAIASPEPRPLELAAIEVTKVKPTSVAERFRVSGELRPVNRVVLKAKADGTVKEVKSRAGQQVKAGDVLVRLDTEELESELAQHNSNLDGARAQLLLAQQTLAKTELLTQRGIMSRAALEKANSDVVAAQANVQGLYAQIDIGRTALRNAEIRAPFDGAVANRAVEPGTAVAANAELMIVVDTSVLEAEVLVSTREVTRLEIGQVAELQIDGLEGQIVTGTVERINPIANEGSRFVSVYVRLENPEGRLWGGMFATGDILVRESKDILVVPATSLREDDAGDFVLKLDGGRLVRQTVKVKSRWNGGADLEIGDGVGIGDIVVTSPLPELKPGMAAIVSPRVG